MHRGYHFIKSVPSRSRRSCHESNTRYPERSFHSFHWTNTDNKLFLTKVSPCREGVISSQFLLSWWKALRTKLGPGWGWVVLVLGFSHRIEISPHDLKEWRILDTCQTMSPIVCPRVIMHHKCGLYFDKKSMFPLPLVFMTMCLIMLLFPRSSCNTQPLSSTSIVKRI